jgi:hypothetical protein
MIYAIRIGDDGPVKIGKSRNPKTRLVELQVSSPLELRLVAVCNWHDQNEVILHHYLRESYLRGEWFEPTERVEEVVRRMKADDFHGMMELVGRMYELPRFDKRKYQREYMATYRAEKKAALEKANTEVKEAPKPNSQDRHSPGYMREYMKVYRAVKAGRAEFINHGDRK